jgi:ABC-type thiamine transport system substrate-binding protein
MRRKYVVPVLLLVVFLAGACATVGAGDPVVVRAEDTLSNSLTIYTTAMNYHFANSTKEGPAVYKAFEDFRVQFPVAWIALDNAKRSYQRDKAGGSANVDAALNALSGLVSAITPLIGGGQ